MKHSCLLPFALMSGLLLSACGARSSLTTPGVNTDCGPWSVRDGMAGARRFAGAPFAVLGDGSVVVPMVTQQPADPGPDQGVFITRSARKIDPDGELAWDAADELLVLDLAVAGDATDTVVVGGTMRAGTWSVRGAKLTCPGPEPCVFIGKLAETGTLSWSKVFPSAAANMGKLGGLAVTGDGRITVGGSFNGTIDLGCGPLTTAIIGDVQQNDRYLAQLSPSGECLWSRAIVGAPLIGPPLTITVNDEGEVALTVPLEGALGAQTIDLGAGPVPFDTKKGPGFAVAKYAPNGDVVFAKVVSGVAEMANNVAGAFANVAMTGAGEVLLSASYEGTLDLGGGPEGSPGTVRHFVTKLGAKGEELWTRDIAAGPPDTPTEWFSLAVEPGGDFFVAGRGLPGMKILDKPTPETALFVAAYDAGGEPASVQTFPLTGTAHVSGLSASADGALVLDGDLAGTLDFGQEPIASEGVEDAFVARICR